MRQVLEDHDYTASQLAAEIDVTPAAVSQWLSGKYEPKGSTMARIANRLGEDLEFLMLRSDGGKQGYGALIGHERRPRSVAYNAKDEHTMTQHLDPEHVARALEIVKHWAEQAADGRLENSPMSEEYARGKAYGLAIAIAWLRGQDMPTPEQTDVLGLDRLRFLAEQAGENPEGLRDEVDELRFSRERRKAKRQTQE